MLRALESGDCLTTERAIPQGRVLPCRWSPTSSAVRQRGLSRRAAVTISFRVPVRAPACALSCQCFERGLYFIRSGPASWEEDRRKRRGVERLSVPPGAPLSLCAGEALLEARTQASVAFFKLGAHSATLRPEFGEREIFFVLSNLEREREIFSKTRPNNSNTHTSFERELFVANLEGLKV